MVNLKNSSTFYETTAATIHYTIFRTSIEDKGIKKMAGSIYKSSFEIYLPANLM